MAALKYWPQIRGQVPWTRNTKSSGADFRSALAAPSCRGQTDGTQRFTAYDMGIEGVDTAANPWRVCLQPAFVVVTVG